MPITEALLADLALEHELFDRARLVKVLAADADAPDLVAIATRLEDAHGNTIQWLFTVLAETAIGGPAALAPTGARRMGANPHANGGLLLRDLRLPDFRQYAVPVEQSGTGAVESTRVLGTWLRDVMAHNMETFRMFSPDENSSNRLQDVLVDAELFRRLRLREEQEQGRCG